MSEQKWFDEYSGQTTDELIALEREYRSDSIVLAFEQALNQKAARIGEDGVTEEERVVLAIEELEREVNNGGYDQFFLNSSKYAPVIVDELNRIGWSETAKLTREAIGILGIEGSLTVEAIDRLMMEEADKEREERLGECDHRYFESAGDLVGPLLKFIKSNRDKINLKD